MVFKFLSVSSYSSFLELDAFTIGRTVLPLFKNRSFTPSKFSFEDACTHIKTWSIHFLKSEPDTENILSLLYDYFNKLRSGTLFANQDSLKPILISIADQLPPFDSNLDSHSVSHILSPFLSTLQGMACLDQHRDELRSILTVSSFSCFDLPIRKFVHWAFNLMDEKINDILNSWSRSAFNGCPDEQSVHSKHILYLLLDDIFHIADGDYKTESDILISRTLLGEKICKRCFNDILSVDDLFSEGSVSWHEHLSRVLSIGVNAPFSSLKFTTQDLVDSPSFIRFLQKSGYLSNDQLTQLKKSADYNCSDDLKFEFSWLKFSNILSEEETVYSSQFSLLLIQFIYQTLHEPFDLSSVPSCESLSSSAVELDSVIVNRLIDQYFLELSPKQPFSFSEIFEVMNVDSSSYVYHRPFLRPYIHLTTIMIGNCEASDVLDVFNNILFPLRNYSWSFDCLLLLFTINPVASSQLPLNLVSTFKNKKGFTPLHSLALSNPDIFCNFICSSPDILSSFQSVLDVDKNTPFHLLAIYSPNIFIQFVSHHISKLDVLGSFRNRFNHSVFHTVSIYNPSIFYLFLLKSSSSISNLYHFKGNNAVSPFHTMVHYNPDCFFKLFEHIPNFFELLTGSFSPNEYSIFHELAHHHGHLLKQLILDNYVCVDFLKTHVNASLETPFHLLACFYPDILFDVKDCIPSSVLYNHLDCFKNSVLHFLAIHNGDTFLKFISHSSDLIPLISNLSNSFGVTPFKYLSQCHTEVFDSLMQSTVLHPFSLLSVLDLSYDFSFDTFRYFTHKYPSLFTSLDSIPSSFLDTPFFWLIRFRSDIVKCCLTNNPHISSVISHYKTTDGDTVFHMMARFNSSLLYSLLRTKFVSVRFLQSLSNRFGDTVFHVLARYDGKVLNRIINNKLNRFKDMGRFTNCSNETIFHVLSDYFPHIVFDMIQKNPDLIYVLGLFKNAYGDTVFHGLSRSHSLHIQSLIEKGVLSKKFLFHLRNCDNKSPLDWCLSRNF